MECKKQLGIMEMETAIETVKKILHILHEKRYEDLPSCVDEMEWRHSANPGVHTGYTGHKRF